MRKSGGFSLFVYLLYLVGGLGFAIYSYIASQSAEGWDGLGYALLMIVGIIAGGVGLVGLIFKLLHMASGFGLFGFLCMLLDIAVIAYLVCALVDGNADVSALILIGPFTVLSFISLISNAASLGGR